MSFITLFLFFALDRTQPSRLSLLHHAKKGGKDAEDLLQYIESKGLTEMMFKIK